MRRSIAIIAAAAVYAAAPARAETTGFCDGKLGGAYAVPGDSACSADYYMCAWDGATDAVARSCPAGTKWRSSGGWNFYCAPEDQVPACEPSPLSGMCAGRGAGSFYNPALPSCTDSFLSCPEDSSVDAVVVQCEAGKVAADGGDPSAQWGLYCTENIAWASGCTLPALVSPVGYCTGVSGAGAVADPNMAPTTTCSNSIWKCNWEGATDAVVSACPDGKAAKFNGATPTWSYECVDPSTIVGCSL